MLLRCSRDFRAQPVDKTLFVINPISGGGRALKTWARARPLVVGSRISFSEHFTTASGDATRATREALRLGARQIVSVGGDGTLNEVVNGYLTPEGSPVNPEARLAILSAGTGSDFGKSLYPLEPADRIDSRHRPPRGDANLEPIQGAINAIAGEASSLIDAGLINCLDRRGTPLARCFINVVSFGLGGDVSRLVNDWRGRLPAWIGGRARFAAAAIRALSH